MNPIIQLILQELPGVIDSVKARHAAANPGAAPLTSDQVLKAFEDTFTSTILKDERIKAAHASHV